MTTSLQITLAGQRFGMPVVVDVLDAEFDFVTRIAGTTGSTATVSVEPGDYCVQARLPSGEQLARRVHVGDRASAVAIDFAPPAPMRAAPIDWLSGTGNTFGLVGSVRTSRDLESFTGAALPAALDVAFCTYGSDGWRTEPARHPIDRSAATVTYETTTGIDELGAVAITGPGLPGRFTLIPAATQRVAITIECGAAPTDPPRVTILRADDPTFDALVAFAHTGDTQGLDLGATAVDAERRLEGKMADPIGAALGAYALLRLRRLDLLHTWTENLAQRFPWLPDGGIVRAFHRVLEGAGADDVMPYVRGSIQAGPPIFAEGMRVLGDLLALLESSTTEARDQLGSIAAMRAAWDPGLPFTTFRLDVLAADPRTPTSWQIARGG